MNTQMSTLRLLQGHDASPEGKDLALFGTYTLLLPFAATAPAEMVRTDLATRYPGHEITVGRIWERGESRIR